MSKKPIPEFNPNKSFKEVTSVPEFDPKKPFTEKKNPSLNEDRFVLPPSHFKQVISPTERIDTVQVPKETDGVRNETLLPTVKITSEEHVAEPAPPQTPVVETEISSPPPASHAERVIERPQIVAERNAKKVSALSLKSIQKKQELKKELIARQPDAQNLPTETFTEEEMISVWNEYSKEIESKGQFNLLSHLTMGVPKLENTLIHLEFPNDTIRVEVERAKFELLTYLREKLRNYDIDLSIEVNETAEKRYAYTTREKFEKLNEKNPLMDTLRKEFDLEI